LRVLIASDLHLELTGSESIRRLAAGMSREDADLIVLAGDLGNPARLFEQCLACFLNMDCPVAVLPGNHDLWSSYQETSILLYEELLPEITRSMGFHWLETEPLVLQGGVGIVGGIAWYDYSARLQALAQTDEEILAAKPRFSMDAQRIDWEYQDVTFAAQCRGKLVAHCAKLEADPRVEKILAVTHVPLYESQVDRHPDSDSWSRGNPYFGHLTAGEALMGFGKLRYVVSGHTHVGLNGLVERPRLAPIATAVVPSEYGKPRWVTVDVE
jgi:hypothetical protein